MAITFKTFNPSTGAYVNTHTGLHEENMQIKVEGVTGTSVQTLTLYYYNGSSYVQLVSRKFYPGISQEIYLDFREDVRSILSLQKVDAADGAEDYAYFTLKLTLGTSATVYLYVHIGSSAVTNTGPLTDIDCLDVDAETQLRLAIVNQQIDRDDQDAEEEDDTVALSVMTQRGLHSAGNYEFIGTLDQVLLYGRKNVSALGVRYDEPFRIVYGAVDSSYTPVKSPIFCLRRGTAEKFLFLNKYGAWDVIPMFGAQKRTPEYTLESVATASGRVQTRAEKEESYTQDSGYLTAQTFLALGDDLLSRQIYHWSGSSWRQITIEETDFAFSKKDDLHSCTFKFRYCDSNYIPSV